MRILHTLDSGGMYGKERMLFALVTKQIEAGHSVDILVLGAESTALYLRETGANVGWPENVKEFSRIVRAVSPMVDIIHTHDYKTGIIINAVANRITAAIIRTVHGYTNVKKYSKLAAYEWLDKKIAAFNDRTVVVSDKLKELLPNSRVINNGIAEVVPGQNGLIDSIVNFCEGYDFTLCCMARLSPEKNLTNLINAVYNVGGVKLMLFGDGPEREQLEALNKMRAAAAGEEKVMFGGFNPVSRDYLFHVDGYIQSSTTEGMPISVLEAMSIGVPLITTSVGGMTVLQSRGYDVSHPCFISEEGMTEAIRLFMGDKAGRAKRAERGKRVFKEVFSADAMYKQYDAVYTTVLKEKYGRP